MKFSIGKSYEGREIWGIKISDNVATSTKDEPEVFIHGLTHARERASNEEALALIQMLTGEYDTNARIKAIVDSREIWIVPMLNPDGAEFDMSGGHWHRGARTASRSLAPTRSASISIATGATSGAGGSGHGTDGSVNPASDYYRGWAPEVAPEVQDYEAFEASRVINGRQRIVASIGFHSAAREVLWPYSHTFANVPPDMSADDHTALVALGQKVAALNGYKPAQGSDLYPVYGDQDDWAYHTYRIFGYTFEMKKGAQNRYYPSKAELDADIAANRDAVLTFLEDADCPYRAAGLTRDCGPLYDDFEIDRGWRVNPNGTDTATPGALGKGGAGKDEDGRRHQAARHDDQRHDGPRDRRGRGQHPNADDVDGGMTTVQAPPAFTLGGAWQHRLDARLQVHLRAQRQATAADYLRSRSVATCVFGQTGFAGNRNATWTLVITQPRRLRRPDRAHPGPGR